MLYVYCGTDIDKARAKWRTTIDAFRTKHPEAGYFLINSENFDPASFEELIVGQTLFAKKYIVALDQLLANKSIGPTVLEKIKLLNASENIFVLLEGEVTATNLKKIEYVADKFQAFEAKAEKVAPPAFNPFILTDLFGARDRKSLWVAMQKAERSGFPAEEVFWKLAWQTKNMLLVKQLAGRKPSGMNPYVASKAAGYARGWSVEELKKLSATLVTIYHQARRGEADFGVETEKLILEI